MFSEIEGRTSSANLLTAKFAEFEIDDEVLANLKEYALANSLYWALAEGHACEISARRNAMDVSAYFVMALKALADAITERLQERWRYDQQVPNSLQSHPTSCHYWRIGGDHYWCCRVRGCVRDVYSSVVDIHSRSISSIVPLLTIVMS